jgi:SAM-dependent methyltransferase
MAISPYTLKQFARLRAYSLAGKHVVVPELKMATLGYPDCLFSVEQAEEAFWPGVCDEVPTRADSTAILAWHSLGKELGAIYETKAFMAAIGFDLTVFDVAEVRGGETLCDFNDKIPGRHHATADVVYDGGSLEHLFNAPQAISNMLALAKPGGYIFHHNPLNVLNHGFYNFNPTFYSDFYRDNGHELVGDIEAVKSSGLEYSVCTLPATDRFNAPAGDHWISVKAKKKHENAVVWPTQTKYKRNPSLVA